MKKRVRLKRDYHKFLVTDSTAKRKPRLIIPAPKLVPDTQAAPPAGEGSVNSSNESGDTVMVTEGRRDRKAGVRAKRSQLNRWTDVAGDTLMDEDGSRQTSNKAISKAARRQQQAEVKVATRKRRQSAKLDRERERLNN